MRWSLAPDVELTDTGSGTVVLDQGKGTYFQVNGTGAMVLRALAAGRGAEGAVADLQAAYPDSDQDIRADVDLIVERIVKAGLVRRES